MTLVAIAIENPISLNETERRWIETSLGQLSRDWGRARVQLDRRLSRARRKNITCFVRLYKRARDSYQILEFVHCGEIESSRGADRTARDSCFGVEYCIWKLRYGCFRDCEQRGDAT